MRSLLALLVVVEFPLFFFNPALKPFDFPLPERGEAVGIAAAVDATENTTLPSVDFPLDAAVVVVPNADELVVVTKFIKPKVLGTTDPVGVMVTLGLATETLFVFKRMVESEMTPVAAKPVTSKSAV